MKFEFDPQKSESNRSKHGLDFVEAQKLWQSVRVEFPAKTTDAEHRYAVLGKIEGVHHTVVITYRGDTIRMISARLSSQNERTLYEQKIPKK